MKERKLDSMSSDKKGLGGEVELGSLSCDLICCAAGLAGLSGSLVWSLGIRAWTGGDITQGPHMHVCPPCTYVHFGFSGARQVLQGFWSSQYSVLFACLLLEPWSSMLGAVHMMSARRAWLEVGRRNALLVSARCIPTSRARV